MLTLAAPSVPEARTIGPICATVSVLTPRLASRPVWDRSRNAVEDTAPIAAFRARKTGRPETRLRRGEKHGAVTEVRRVRAAGLEDGSGRDRRSGREVRGDDRGRQSRRRRADDRLDLGLRPLPHRARNRRWRRPSSAGRSPPPWRAIPSGCASARWSAATATATRPSTPRSPPPSMSPATAGWTPASAPAGTSTSGGPTATAFRTRRSGCACSARPARSSTRCGREDYATFEGKRYQIDGAINEPKGVAEAAPAALDRRRRREGDAQAGRAVRRRLQRRRRQPGDLPPEAGDSEAATARR